MKTQTPPQKDNSSRKDILQGKSHFGLAYGLVAGLSFAISNWGLDAYLLSQAHALQPWLKLIVALLVCVPLGGLTGWLASYLDKALLSTLLWLAAGAVFAWLSVADTFQIYPALLAKLDPETAPLLDYSINGILQTNGVMVYIWTSIFWGIVGLIQLPLLEQAAFSLSLFPKLTPFLVALTLILVGGLFVDNLNNEPLRSPILALDKTIQFAIDTRGQEVDRETARKMHLGALRTVQEWLNRPRYYFVGSFDDYLTQVHVIVNFGGKWADCIVVSNQISYCKSVSP